MISVFDRDIHLPCLPRYVLESRELQVVVLSARCCVQLDDFSDFLPRAVVLSSVRRSTVTMAFDAVGIRTPTLPPPPGKRGVNRLLPLEG